MKYMGKDRTPVNGHTSAAINKRHYLKAKPPPLQFKQFINYNILKHLSSSLWAQDCTSLLCGFTTKSRQCANQYTRKG